MTSTGAAQKPQPLNRGQNTLIWHDAMIARAHWRALLRRPKDLISLAVLIAGVAALIRLLPEQLPGDYREILIATLCSGFAAALDLALRSRLSHFAQETAFSQFALLRSARLRYRFVAHGLASILAVALLAAPDPKAALGLLAAWWLTLVPIELIVRLLGLVSWSSRPIARRVFAAVPRSRYHRSAPVITSAVLALCLAAAGLLAGGTWVSFAAAAVAVATVGWFAPADHRVIRFEGFAGYSALASVRSRLRRASLAAVILLAGAAVSMNWTVAGFVFLGIMTVLIYQLLAILLARFLAPRQAELALFMVLLVIISFSFMFPPLAPVVFTGSVLMLLGKAKRVTWQLS